MADPRCRQVPEHYQQMVRDCIRRRGVAGAAKVIGLGRSATLAIAAGEPVMPGTLAIVREYARRRADAEAKVSQLTGQVAAALTPRKGDR